MKNKKQVTILDVAERAGVSRAPAGRIIGNYGTASEEAKEKVLRAIKELDYTPNVIAQGLRSKSTKTIGVVVGSIKNNFCNQFLYAVEKVCLDKGYNVLFCNTNEEPGREIEQLKNLRARQVDGIVLISAISKSKGIPKQYKSLYTGMPIALADRRIKDLNLDIVTSGNFKGAYDATKHFIDLGHRKIAVLASSSYSTILERLDGYRQALQDHEIEHDETLELIAPFNDAFNEDSIKELLEKNPGITAIMVLNNSLLCRLLEGLRNLNYRVPDDISVISWDDDDLNILMEIDTVVQQVEKMGQIAVERVFELIDPSARKGEPLSVTLGTVFKERKSCRKME